MDEVEKGFKLVRLEASSFEPVMSCATGSVHNGEGGAVLVFFNDDLHFWLPPPLAREFGEDLVKKAGELERHLEKQR